MEDENNNQDCDAVVGLEGGLQSIKSKWENGKFEETTSPSIKEDDDSLIASRSSNGLSAKAKFENSKDEESSEMQSSVQKEEIAGIAGGMKSVKDRWEAGNKQNIEVEVTEQQPMEDESLKAARQSAGVSIKSRFENMTVEDGDKDQPEEEKREDESLKAAKNFQSSNMRNIFEKANSKNDDTIESTSPSNKNVDESLEACRQMRKSNVKALFEQQANGNDSINDPEQDLPKQYQDESLLAAKSKGGNSVRALFENGFQQQQSQDDSLSNQNRAPVQSGFAKNILSRFEQAPTTEIEGNFGSAEATEIKIARFKEEELPPSEITKSTKQMWEQKINQKPSNDSADPVKKQGKKFVANTEIDPSECCPACSKRVYQMESLMVGPQSYHKDCFRCTSCNNKLRLGDFSAAHGSFYCKYHYQELFRLKGNYEEGFGVEKLNKKDTSSPIITDSLPTGPVIADVES